MNIALEAILAKMLPIDEIKATIEKHTGPMTKQLIDKRLKRVIEDMVLGILGGEKHRPLIHSADHYYDNPQKQKGTFLLW